MTTNDEPRDSVDPGLVRPGGISYLHIPATDVGAAARFYESVFGWDVHGHDSARPGFVDGTGHVAGAWMSDQAEAVERVVAYGGEIVAAPYAEGNLSVATFRDPSGNVMGLWQEVG